MSILLILLFSYRFLLGSPGGRWFSSSNTTQVSHPPQTWINTDVRKVNFLTKDQSCADITVLGYSVQPPFLWIFQHPFILPALIFSTSIPPSFTFSPFLLKCFCCNCLYLHKRTNKSILTDCGALSKLKEWKWHVCLICNTPHVCCCLSRYVLGKM